MTTIKAVREDEDTILTSNNELGYLTMNKYGHLNINIKSIDGNSLSMGLDTNDNITQRLCISNDDGPSIDTQNYLTDFRFNSNCRPKMCGGIGNIAPDEYYIPTYNSVLRLQVILPLLGNIMVNLDNLSDVVNSSIYFKYIDLNGIINELTIIPNGLYLINLGSNIREIIEFNFTSSENDYNQGNIFLTNIDDTIIDVIPPRVSNYVPVRIEVPQNGYTLLKSLTISSLERVDLDVYIDVIIVIQEIYLINGSYSRIYRTIFNQQCRNRESITFDLSEIPPIYGSQSKDSNFAIYSAIKAVGGSSTMIQTHLIAINVD